MSIRSPLASLGRIKVKLGAVIVLAVATAFLVNEVGIALGAPTVLRLAVAAILALLMVQVLAHGMTKPLRQMAAGAQTIARGRYDLRVDATSADEVGELARAFNAMASDLAEVDRQRRELVANVSHELRTPITALRALLENLVDGVSAPDHATLGTALAQAERLGRLVSQLLDLSRLESGARLLDLTDVDLADLCDQAAKEAVLGGKPVEIRCEVAPGLAVRADPDLLAQVLANLLDNAVRHSPPGGVITVGAQPHGEGVRLTVRDEGPGIPAADRTRVFERFSRLDASRAADQGGTGLGLAITKEIVELHNGTIQVEPGPGCTMRIDLPGRTTMTESPRADDSPGTSDSSTGDESSAAPTTPATSQTRRQEAGPEGSLVTAATGSEPNPSASDRPAAQTGPASPRPVPASAPPSSAPPSSAPPPSAPPPSGPPPSAQWTPPLPPPPYVPPPLFPRPDVPDAPSWLLPGASAVGLLAAFALPFSDPGLGFVLVTVAMGAAVLPALRGRLTPWTATFLALTYGLAGMAVVRDAEWLVVLTILGAFPLATLAVSGAGRHWLGVIRGAVSVPLAYLPLPWFLAPALRRLGMRKRAGSVLVGVGLTAIVVTIFGALLASADAVFSTYVERVLQVSAWVDTLPARIIVFGMVATMVAAAVLVALRPVRDPALPRVAANVNRATWLLPLTALNLLFATFIVVQLSVLFGGQRQVLRTVGLTYAEYARSGFFQLAWTSLFVLGVIAVVTGTLTVSGRDRWLMALELGLLCGLTLVILSSAHQRLALYVDMYGLSRLRACVGAAILWLAVVFVLVLVAGALRLVGRGRAAWLPRTLVAVSAAGLLAFAVWNPDYRIAQSQLEVRQPGTYDLDYLRGLSADAVPALQRLPEPERSCVLSEVVRRNRLDEPDPWNGWNLARARARDLVAANPADPSVSCPNVDASPW
jgi:signal transduction histidine kinase